MIHFKLIFVLSLLVRKKKTAGIISLFFVLFFVSQKSSAQFYNGYQMIFGKNRVLCRTWLHSSFLRDPFARISPIVVRQRVLVRVHGGLDCIPSQKVAHRRLARFDSITYPA